MRFFLIDKIKELIPGETAIGVKCWSLDNQIFEDHNNIIIIREKNCK